jgi:hypothetical protein
MMEKQVLILTDAEPAGSGIRSGDDIGGGFGLNPSRTGYRLVKLGADELRAQIANLLEVVDHVFAQASEQSSVCLDQIDLSIEISSEGQVSIMGTGGKAGGRGAIKLVFKRRDP